MSKSKSTKAIHATDTTPEDAATAGDAATSGETGSGATSEQGDGDPTPYAGTPTFEDPAPAASPEQQNPTGDELLAKANVNGPRVTVEKLAAEIEAEFYFTPMDAAVGLGVDSHIRSDSPLARLTFCVLVLKNGFTVTGQSACVSPENFRADVGKAYAREDAERKMWQLLGFRLADRIHNQLPL
jgi:hypothetical protein